VGLAPGVLINIAAKEMVMQNIHMALFGEYLQIQHSIAPRRKHLAGGAVVAVGNDKSIGGSEKALGNMAECAALYLKYH